MKKLDVKHENKWQEIAEEWNSFSSPLRPSPEELAIFDLVAKIKANKKEQPKALLLGDSPEIRDILAKYDYETTIIANNPDAVFAMNKLTNHKGRKKEKLIISDWQAMNLKDNNYDLIASDWSLNFLPTWCDYTLVFDRVKKYLHKDGLFIFRLGIYRFDQRRRGIKEIMSDYAYDKKNKYSYLMELQLYSDITTYVSRSFQADLKIFFNNSLFKSHVAGDISLDHWQDLYHPMTDVLTYPEKDKLKELICHFFILDDEKFGNDYLFSQNNPIYICKHR